MKRDIPVNKPKYRLNAQGEFIIENYNFAKPFADFFPGIAGRYGIPLWVFYVNRGQGIAGFGSKDKDHAIMEFLPANKAWQQTSLLGFRTFIKIYSGKNILFYEPFQNMHMPANGRLRLNNRMLVSSYDLKLQEDNPTLGLSADVEYFTIPNDNYGALARTITIKNTHKTPKKIQIIDGLPQIVPFGTNNFFLKKMSRTIEAWMKVENLKNRVPFYKLAVDPSDRPEVIHIKEGNFYLPFHYRRNKPEVIKPVVDPQVIFGPVSDFTYPHRFLNTKNFHYPESQSPQSKTPCAFLFSDFELKTGEEKTFYAVTGYMLNQEILNTSVNKIIKPGYLAKKKEENKNIIEALQNNIYTSSGIRPLDLYARQTYLDNILRGGFPITFSPPQTEKSGSNKTIFYVYSRKHGDIERDYNRFQIQPTYFSQGNGNYRDVNQNRRSDIWFNPDLEDENVITFFNLLQTDGFNPLLIKGVTFTLKNPQEFNATLKNLIHKGDLETISRFLSKPFTPGEVILFLEENKIELNITADEFLNILLSHCDKHQDAEHGEGFWTDHWTYNLDILESYFGVYPENLKELLCEKRVFTFFDNLETVKPRSEKYVLYNAQVKQLHSLSSDTRKKEMIHKRSQLPHTVRTNYGEGEVYYTTLINKLFCLLANKMASLDPFGTGIEMEADKPNWYDALNGLPALSGSSLSETLELKRLIIFIKTFLLKIKTQRLSITEEIYDFLAGLDTLTQEFFKSNSTDKDYFYWDKTHSLKEEYRQKTKLGLSGNELEKSAGELTAILDKFLRKTNEGIDKAFNTQKNMYYAYFINEVSEYELLKAPYVKPLKFLQKKLPFFLESQVHALKITKDKDKAKRLYEAVKKSSLYDKALKMYKVNSPLADMPEEIGRCRVFTPGWLENESIWLHMEYKYLLEILRAGLYEDFYKEFKSLLIPFQKPEKYGRSILENSSFMVSSAFPDKNLHGTGFVARLSGSTAEFIQIWLIMNLGLEPFFLNERNELNLRFQPILASWLFNKAGLYSFNFLGEILLTYHNPSKKNTFSKNAVIPKKIIFKDKDVNQIEINSNTIPSPYAAQIRNRQVNSIDVYLG